MSRTGSASGPAGSVADGRARAATVGRKADHIRINLHEDVAAKGVDSGFAAYRFLHQALPEIDLDSVDTSVEVLGRRLAAPLLISSMTGGTPEARAINRSEIPPRAIISPAKMNSGIAMSVLTLIPAVSC